jgi:hypothetical protein
MKRLVAVFLFLAMLPYLPVRADDKDHGGGGGGERSSSSGGGHASAPRQSHQARQSHAMRSQPRHHNAAPLRNRVQSSQQHGVSHMNGNHAVSHVQGGASMGVRSSHVAISPALRNLGVTQAPHRFTSRSQILSTDAAHSVVEFPHAGYQGHAIVGQAVSAQHFNDPAVRNHMNFIVGANHGFGRADLALQLRGEAGIGQYYWHHNDGFDYCHYNDHWGYSWYGWYSGQNYFWTRYYGNRWWFYDNGYNRWCYWSNGYWWWQDPDNLDNEYIYQDDQYVPADMGPAPTAGRKYLSSDGSCLVKIQGDNNDAYLLDPHQPPVYEPLLLATGVTNLKFFEPKDSSPIQIMLTLSDGSVKVFDDQGNPQNFEEPAAQEENDADEAVDSGGNNASSQTPPTGGSSPAPGDAIPAAQPQN